MSAWKAKAFWVCSAALALPALFLWTMRRASTDVAEREGSVAELIVRLECGTCPLKERNRAVWALGQSSYGRDGHFALPALRRQLAAVPDCDHSKRLCRYELHKAILKIEGKWDLRASLFARRH